MGRRSFTREFKLEAVKLAACRPRRRLRTWALASDARTADVYLVWLPSIGDRGHDLDKTRCLPSKSQTSACSMSRGWV